jgi:hypothetical protein
MEMKWRTKQAPIRNDRPSLYRWFEAKMLSIVFGSGHPLRVMR